MFIMIGISNKYFCIPECLDQKALVVGKDNLLKYIICIKETFLRTPGMSFLCVAWRLHYSPTPAEGAVGVKGQGALGSGSVWRTC